MRKAIYESMRVLVNFLGFQIGWWACVYGAVYRVPYIGLVTVAVVVLLHLGLNRWRVSEIALLAWSAVVGYVGDSLLVLRGLIDFAPENRLLGPSPLWMVALWICFATTLNTSLRWLQGRWLMAALLGALGGPLAYLGGSRLGAMDLGPDRAQSLMEIGLLWVVVTPVLVWSAAFLRQRLDRRPRSDGSRDGRA